MHLPGRPKSLSKGTENCHSKDIRHFFSGKIMTKAVPADKLTTPDLQDTAIIRTTCSDVQDTLCNPSDSDPQQESENVVKGSDKTKKGNVEYFKGHPVDVDRLVKRNAHCLHKFQRITLGNKNRIYIKCTLCEKYEDELRPMSRNGNVPLASGIRADSKEKVMAVIDHLLGTIHKRACQIEKDATAFANMSPSHPWIRLIQQHDKEVIERLIQMAMDIYNDAKYGTLSAHSWPARSLTVMRSQEIIGCLSVTGECKEDVSKLPKMQPSGVQMHYL
jgi:hypothetical protein